MSDPESGSGPGFHCGTCGFPCATNSDLQLHCAYNHYFGLIYVCKFCEQEFEEKVEVAEHILQHHVILGQPTPQLAVPTDEERLRQRRELKLQHDSDGGDNDYEDYQEDGEGDHASGLHQTDPVAAQLLAKHERKEAAKRKSARKQRAKKRKEVKAAGQVPGVTVLDNPDIVNQASSSIDYTMHDKDEVKREADAIIRTATSDKVCPVCQKAFCSRQVRDRHVVSVHLGARLFKCDKCYKTFKSTSERGTHFRRVHLQIRDVKCRFCMKAFSSTGVRNLHERSIHHGIPKPVKPPKKCEECGVVFKSHDTYSRHYKVIHLGLKPFKCPVCGEAFKDSGTLSIHKKEVHLLTLFDSKAGFKRGESRYKARSELVPVQMVPAMAGPGGQEVMEATTVVQDVYV